MAVAEMAFAGGLGADLDVSAVPTEDVANFDDVTLLFSESNSRFVCEIEPDRRSEFEDVLGNLPFARIGTVSDGDQLIVRGADPARIVIRERVGNLKESWQTTLREV